MRIVLFIAGIFFLSPIHAQDQQLLQKQMKQILADFPNKFKNLTDPKEEFTLKFIISGTTEKPFIMDQDADVYISAGLPDIQNEQSAKAFFSKWVTTINKLDFNGAPLKKTDCTGSQFSFLCSKWQFDASKFSMDPAYKTFTILVEVVKVEEAYAASLKIGANL